MMIDEIKAVFMEECIKWLTKESTEPVDEELLAEKLCDAMYHTFRTPSEKLGRLYPPLDCNKVLETIERKALRCSFSFKRVSSRNKPSNKCEWILKREKDIWIESDSEMHIVVSTDNYIIVIGESWGMDCFGCETLENVIGCWAHGNMP